MAKRIFVVTHLVVASVSWTSTLLFPIMCQQMQVAAQNVGESFAANENECTMGSNGQCVSVDTLPTSECENTNKYCIDWARRDECKTNPNFMLKMCAKACGVCGKTFDEVHQLIEEYGKETQKLYENHGLEQNIPMGDSLIDETVQTWWRKTKAYMEEVVYKEARYKSLEPGACQNLHPDCTIWAARGECQKNPAYMDNQCKPACRMCHTLIFEERCPYDGSQETNAWKQPGDLSKMFERIITEPSYQQLHGPLHVLSKPGGGGGGGDEVLDGPWVIMMDNFLSKEECERLIELGENRGYKRSVVNDKAHGKHADLESEHRTSSNAWCLDECYHDETTQTILRRLEDMTGMSDGNAEHFQLLKYEVGQHYGQHHDYLLPALGRLEGVRILTVFLYLNDVPAGGETRFTALNLTVTPKQGRVLIWPNVLDEDPNKKDHRTEHEALPVKEGLKFATNAWYHQRDFKESMARGCQF